MKIPVFVSRPTTLSPSQESSYQLVCTELKRCGLEERRLGKSDYPTEFPLREILVLARHCSGAVILGFEQLQVITGTWKRGTIDARPVSGSTSISTPWNQLEAGILFSLQVPLLVFKEDGIAGGIFDNGVTDAFVHRMPCKGMTREERAAFSSVFTKWQAKVRDHYYR